MNYSNTLDLGDLKYLFPQCLIVHISMKEPMCIEFTRIFSPPQSRETILGLLLLSIIKSFIHQPNIFLNNFTSKGSLLASRWAKESRVLTGKWREVLGISIGIRFRYSGDQISELCRSMFVISAFLLNNIRDLIHHYLHSTRTLQLWVESFKIKGSTLLP